MKPRRSFAVAQIRFLSTRLFMALVLLAAALPAWAQTKYSSAEEAYDAGARLVNSGNIAGAREPLEAALMLAKNDAFRLKVNRGLLIPYRELPDIGPMQKAAEYIIANSAQAAERSLTRGSLLGFIQIRGKMEAAVAEYEARLKKTPDDRTVLYLLVEAYDRYKKDPARSAELGEKLASVEKKLGKGQDLASQAQLAQQYVKADKLTEGAELFEKIAPLDAKTEAWHLKEAAAAWLKAGQKAKAIAAAKKSVAGPAEKRSVLLTYFWRRGVADVFLGAGEPALAIPQYEAAIAASTIEGYTKDSRAKLLEAQEAAKK